MVRDTYRYIGKERVTGAETDLQLSCSPLICPHKQHQPTSCSSLHLLETLYKRTELATYVRSLVSDLVSVLRGTLLLAVEKLNFFFISCSAIVADAETVNRVPWPQKICRSGHGATTALSHPTESVSIKLFFSNKPETNFFSNKAETNFFSNKTENNNPEIRDSISDSYCPPQQNSILQGHEEFRIWVHEQLTPSSRLRKNTLSTYLLKFSIALLYIVLGSLIVLLILKEIN